MKLPTLGAEGKQKHTHIFICIYIKRIDVNFQKKKIIKKV